MEPLANLTRSAAMLEVLRTIERVSSSDLSIVIVGEHGTGKEWAARIIHQLSTRSKNSFLPFDCAAMPAETLERELFGYEALAKDGVFMRRGVIEEAATGTLLLNEIASLPASTQKKVARALEYKSIVRIGGDQQIRVDVRVIATQSQQSGGSEVEGPVDKESFYRISPIVIELPPLRSRREDILLLVERFLSETPRRKGAPMKYLNPEAMRLCLYYDWPGNVLQLKNAIEYASVMCMRDMISPEDLPTYLCDAHSTYESAYSANHKKRKSSKKQQ